jgi:O-antigen ligase
MINVHPLSLSEPASSKQRLRAEVLSLAAFVVCALAIVKGGLLAYTALAASGGALLFLLFSQIQFPVLVAWVVLTVIAYPFARLPDANPIVTFDRVWVVAMVSCILLARPTLRMSAATRLLCWSLWWLAAAYGLRALFTSGHQVGELIQWVDAIVLPLVVFTVARRLVTTRQRCVRLASALSVAGGVLAGIGISQALFGFELATRSGGAPRFDSSVGLVRISGPYRVPEVYAVSLLVCLAATLYWARARGRSSYVVGGAVALLEIVAIGLTLFRAFWISAVVIVVIVLGRRPGRPGRTLAITVAVVTVVALLLLQLGGTHTVSTRLRNTENITGRLEIYEVALELFRGAPLVGVGVHQFAAAHAALPSASQARASRFPHSSYLAVLAEQGVWGFLPLVLTSFSVAVVVRQLRRRARLREDVLLAAALGAAAVAYFFVSLSLTMLPYGASNAFLAVLLGAGAARLDAITDRDAVEARPAVEVVTGS